MAESCKNSSEVEDKGVIKPFYTGKEAEGFNLFCGNEWIYPKNYPVREYQKNIVSNALFKNTLVCLPTGLGKTFIAAVVMYNYHRWYPSHIIVFTAHSKPLVSQQVNACCNIMGISKSSIAELNGSMSQASRKKQWESKRIFFLTPQVFNNDLARGNVKPENIKCIVFDEAHKALGNQAYCQIIRSIKPFNSQFRVLALSATPGDQMNMVEQVIKNLLISHLELRNEEDPDIKPYLHEKKVETVVVELGEQIIGIKEEFLRAVDKYIQPLMRNKLIPQSFSSISPYSLLLKQRQFMQNSNFKPQLRGLMISNFSVAVSLFYALEELLTHGMRSFVTKLKNIQAGQCSTNKAHSRLGNDVDIKSLIEHVEGILGPDHNVSFDANASLTRILDDIDSIKTDNEVVYSHPKFVVLEKIIQDHFKTFKESTRVIVFCKSRQCTVEICNFLARFRPLVKPMVFIGQSQSSGGIVLKGFTQAAQLTVMKKFREGVYNTLVATCVAEEGLDIGEVDLIVNFDSGKNSNTQVQRSGRTGRKRDGRVVNLVTEGKEHNNYNISVWKGKKMNKRLSNTATKLPFYLDDPRLIPKSLNPVCLEMHFVPEKEVEEESQKKKKGKAVKKKLQNTNFQGNTPARKKTKLKDADEDTGWNMAVERKYGSPSVEKLVSSVSEESSSVIKSKRVDIEVIDLVEDEKPSMLLHVDDVNESNNSLLFLLDEIQNNEKTTLLEFFRSNDCRIKPKNKFRELIHLGKYRKLMNLAKSDEKELTRRLRMTKDNKLNNSELERLQNEDFSVKDVTNYFNSSIVNTNNKNSKPSVTHIPNESISLKSSDKENEAPVDCNQFMDDLDPDDFLEPFGDSLTSPLANVVSSTPVTKVFSEKKIKMANENSEHAMLLDINFENWEESDFGMKDISSKDAAMKKTSKNSSTKKNSSMVTITQALNMVKNSGTSVQSSNQHNKPPTPTSPILFFSQKPKSQRNHITQSSPILTQKRTSRKCLDFKDNISESLLKIDGFKEDIGNESDLFAETELALQNHITKLEEVGDVERQFNKSPIIVSDENTQEYDLRDINFDQNGVFNSYTDKSDNSLCNREVLDRRIVETNTTNLNATTRTSPGSKTAVAKPLDFESALRHIDESKILGAEVKAIDASFSCSFSLLDVHEFSESSLNLGSKKPTEKEEISRENIIAKDDESSNDSNIFIKKPNDSDKIKNNISRERFNMPEEEKLSQGAIEAIKAVEIYEKDVELAHAVNEAKELYCDSDDSGEYFIPNKKQNKSLNANESPKKQKPKKIKNFKANKEVDEFIDGEAGISSDVTCSSDDENTSGLDEYDSSFLDERDVCTQAADVDMTAKYLQSTKAAVVRAGAFKIPGTIQTEELNVYSQIGSEGESDYEKDSFCVSGEEETPLKGAERSEISELELAEIVLQNKYKKKKRKTEESPAPPKPRKLKRVQRIESDSEDEVQEEKPPLKKNESSSRKNDNLEELLDSPFPSEIEKIDSGCLEKVSAETVPNKPVLFVASRQIASAPDITTVLRAKWNVLVHVRSAPEADYIVSWRVGVNRIQLSDFCSGSAAAKNSLKEAVQKLIWNFQKPVLIIEDDKHKGLPWTTGCQRTMWAKHSCKTLVKTIQNNIKVMFSRSKDDTARILALVCRSESIKGHYINVSEDIHPEIERKVKFFNLLPGVNIVNAFRISNEFMSISSFIRFCDSVNRIMSELGLKKEAAVKVYKLLFTASP